MNIPFRDDSQTTDFERRHEHAVCLVVRDLGGGIHADFPPGLLDDIIQDKVLTGQLADEANKNREFDIVEVEGDTSGGVCSRFSLRGGRKQKSSQHYQETDERGLPGPPQLSERETIHDFQTMNAYAERPIIPWTASSMTEGRRTVP